MYTIHILAPCCIVYVVDLAAECYCLHIDLLVNNEEQSASCTFSFILSRLKMPCESRLQAILWESYDILVCDWCPTYGTLLSDDEPRQHLHRNYLLVSQRLTTFIPLYSTFATTSPVHSAHTFGALYRIATFTLVWKLLHVFYRPQSLFLIVSSLLVFNGTCRLYCVTGVVWYSRV